MDPSSSKNKLKSTFRPIKTHRPLYTGGKVDVSPDGRFLATTRGEEVIVTDLESGQEWGRTKSDTEDITTLCLIPTKTLPTLAIFSRSNTLRLYPLPTAALPSSSPFFTPSRVTPKAHDAPVLLSLPDTSSSFLASGSADGVVKVWDIRRGYVTHVFRGHGGPVSALAWRTQGGALELVTGSADAQIRIWDLKATAAGAAGVGKAGPKPRAVLQGHVSVVRGLAVTSDGKTLLSAGRDRVVLVWDLEPAPTSKKGSSAPKLRKTIPTLDVLEGVGFTDDKAEQLWTAGEGGLRIWDLESEEVVRDLGGKALVSDEEEEAEGGVLDVLRTATSLIAVHADQTLSFHCLFDPSSPPRQIIGYADEIIDTIFLSPALVALATNSPSIPLLTRSGLPFADRILTGHTETVLALSGSPEKNLLLSGSKDRSVRLWRGPSWRCVALGTGHAEAVGAVVLARRSGAFAVSASQDKTVKVWDLSSALSVNEDDEPVAIRSLVTQKIHDKDINALDLSPNDRLLASASQDKTAKIFEVAVEGGQAALKLVGTLKGHRRGVWSVRFSSHERVVATGSGDRSIKIWSLNDFSCLKTFEGHTNSILRVDFLSAGQQLVSAASDGLVKLWDIRSEECRATLDGHEDKVWALAVSPDDNSVVSGGADSLLTFWEDRTDDEQREKLEKKEEDIMREQDFLNFVQLKDYKSAILLALKMDQPRRLLTLFMTVHSERDPSPSNTSITGHPAVDLVLKGLSSRQLRTLMTHVRTWNASARTAALAQRVLHALLKLQSAEDIRRAFESAKRDEDAEREGPLGEEGKDRVTGEFVPHTLEGDGSAQKRRKGEDVGLRDIVDALVPYTERHFARADRTVMESFVVDYILDEMDGLFGGEVMDVDL